METSLLSYCVNLSRWRIFCRKIAIFSQFQLYLNITEAKQIINLLFLSNNFYFYSDIVLTSAKRKRIIVYGLVTRYGPQISCQRKVNLEIAYLSIVCFSLFSFIWRLPKSSQAKQIINLLLPNNFYSVISYRRVQKESDVITVQYEFGHSLWSANHLPAQ